MREFTAEHLRMMIGQQIGLPYLVPVALEFLRTDPFTAGDCCGGDLLAAVLRAEAAFWREHPELRREAAQIAERAFSLLPSLDDCDRPTAQDALTEAYHLFQRAQTTAA